MIEIRNLKKTYQTDSGKIIALNDINLSINNGDIFGIIGLSGAGKSSLVRCINMLEAPDSGEILIKGTDITRLKPASLRESRKKIGMIFQHFNLLSNSTVFENIAFPLRISHLPKNEIFQRVNNLLELVDLKDKAYAYPAQLSGGQKQRVGIARALANNPEIILSDEATSALDPVTTEYILDLLKDINKKFGITVIVITHEMQVIKRLCSRVAILENGSVVEKGDVLDIYANPRTETSRSFLKDSFSTLAKSFFINTENNKQRVIRASFIGNSSNKPVISSMIKKCDIEANILAGNIENIQDTQVGNLVIKISGSEKSIDEAVAFLEANEVGIEVLNK
ncbi:MAG: ATP-binding cassette domain-containing protein [Bacillota bacterium]|nr:ATP-binding cassette domain-containing protein [Bacillota bacterium]